MHDGYFDDGTGWDTYGDGGTESGSGTGSSGDGDIIYLPFGFYETYGPGADAGTTDTGTAQEINIWATVTPTPAAYDDILGIRAQAQEYMQASSGEDILRSASAADFDYTESNSGGDIVYLSSETDYTDYFTSIVASLNTISERQGQTLVHYHNVELMQSIQIGLLCMVIGGLVAYGFLHRILN